MKNENEKNIVIFVDGFTYVLTEDEYWEHIRDGNLREYLGLE